MDDRILYIVDLINNDLLYRDIECYADAYRMYFAGYYVNIDTEVSFDYDTVNFDDIHIEMFDRTSPSDTDGVLQEIEEIFNIINEYNGTMIQM